MVIVRLCSPQSHLSDCHPVPQVFSTANSFPRKPSNPYLDKKKEAQVEQEEVASICPAGQPGLSIGAYYTKWK